MDLSWQLAVAGALVGLSVGLTGMGGGALMTPILVLFFGVDPTTAVGSDLLVSVTMKPVGAAVHQRAGTVRWELVRWIVPAGVPAGFAGAFVLHLLGDGALLQHRVKLAIGAALLAAVAGMIARVLLSRFGRTRAAALGPSERLVVRPLPTVLIGLVGGFIVGLTSVGSGSLIIVMLMLCYPRLRAADLVGTDLVQAVPLVGAAALGHLLAGDVRLALTGSLLLGALPAIYLGAKLSTNVPGAVLKGILGVLLLGSGLQLWGLSTTLVCVISLAFAIAVGLYRYGGARYPPLGSRPSS
ncbi:MAG TPA: sulfite exporter TauE/SafE family protein [Thermomicrobiaceae bacterium]|nr:sulfite exporter TauE/SafE family protein [Thermomicrobiaceae bacterium]